MNGIEFVQQISQSAAPPRYMMISGHDDINYVERALAAGAAGYLLKGNPDEVVDGIRQVLNGNRFLSADLAAKRKSEMWSRSNKGG
jgi:DNA-binding NarL/FixJ family response regulator